MIAIGTRKGLFIAEKSAGTWRIGPPSFGGVQVPMVLPDPRSGALLAAVEHGHFGTKLHRSQDAGATWEEATVPAWPEKPADAMVVKCPWRGIEVPWSLEKIWSLETGGADVPGVLWCGTIPGGLFRSADGGDSWELNMPLWNEPKRTVWSGGGYDYPGIHSISVDPRDSRTLLAAISCGGVWRTQDGGQTWSQSAHGMRAEFTPPDQALDPEIQDPHRMVRCHAAPDHLWVQHHNGIFRSRDAGHSWTEVENVMPSNFGFAVAVHPQDPDTAWFVPGQKDECRIPVDGKFVVTRTTDGGQTVQQFSAGLPQEQSWHLVYRHCLEVAADGRTLVMGSTTGSLWISEDAGESWQRISCDLPPVFCLRFME